MNNKQKLEQILNDLRNICSSELNDKQFNKIEGAKDRVKDIISELE